MLGTVRIELCLFQKILGIVRRLGSSSGCWSRNLCLVLSQWRAYRFPSTHACHTLKPRSRMHCLCLSTMSLQAVLLSLSSSTLLPYFKKQSSLAFLVSGQAQHLSQRREKKGREIEITLGQRKT